MSRLRTAGWLVMTAASVLMAGTAFLYVTGSPQDYDAGFRGKYIAQLGVVWGHGVASTLALAIGPFQFWGRLRQRSPRTHRCIGLIYMACMLVGGLTAIPMGLDAHGGVASQVGFCMFGPLWIGTAAIAWHAAIKRDFRTHREWMIRNFALTFGAVLLRVYLYVLQQMGFVFDDIYPFVTWGAWLPTIVMTEVALRAQRPAPRSVPAVQSQT